MKVLFSLFLLLPILSLAQDESDCYEKFFTRTEEPSTPGKIMLVQKNGTVISLASFVRKNTIGEPVSFKPMAGLIDLDKDGKKELVIYTFTGGAHCCDEFYFYTYVAPNKYKLSGKTFAGDVCVTDNNEFIYNFYEQLGYFFTCFACAYEDTTDAGPLPIHSIMLQYAKGRLQVAPPDKELKAKINDNLAKLSEQPYEKMEDETSQDNGLRKEFALNLAVYYYSYGKNMPAVQQLFNKYYKYPDARKVWSTLVQDLNAIRQSNSF